MTAKPAFEDVFARELGYVLHSLRRLGTREADLEDLAQDVFMAVHRRYDDFDARRPIRPWLFAFAFRAASNHRRLARHQRESVFEAEPPDSAVPPGQEPELQRRQRRDALLRALSTLDLKHRAALALVDLDGVAPKDAAEALEIPVPTLYSRVRNGRRKLREALEADGALHRGASHG